MAKWWDVGNSGDFCLAAFEPINAPGAVESLRNLTGNRRYDAYVANGSNPFTPVASHNLRGWNFATDVTARIDVPIPWAGNYTVMMLASMNNGVNQNFTRPIYAGGGSMQIYWLYGLGQAAPMTFHNGTATAQLRLKREITTKGSGWVWDADANGPLPRPLVIGMSGATCWAHDSYAYDDSFAEVTTSGTGSSASVINIGNRDDNARHFCGAIQALVFYSITLPHAALLELSERMRNIEEWSAWRSSSVRARAPQFKSYWVRSSHIISVGVQHA